MARFTKELRSEFEPFWIVWRVRENRVELNAFEGYENVLRPAGRGASFANLGFDSGDVHRGDDG